MSWEATPAPIAAAAPEPAADTEPLFPLVLWPFLTGSVEKASWPRFMKLREMEGQIEEETNAGLEISMTFCRV